MDFDWSSFTAAGDATNDHANHNGTIISGTSSQHHLTAPSRETLSGLGFSYVPSRPPRPSSSASFLSIASSPGPMRQFSSPPQELRAPSRRSRTRKEAMDVKVLYILDSHPNSTLVAQVEKLVPVQIVSFGKRNEKRRSVLFGKVTLKTCLRAICMASPELMMEKKQDYIVYSVDPIESYRSTKRSGSGITPFASTSTLPAEASGIQMERDAPTTKDGKVSSAFVVGKGFFSWALAEQGDGQSLINGRVRDEYAEDGEEDLSIDNEGNGNEHDFSGKILEVSLRLKAASSLSREQYVDRVNAIQSISNSLTPATITANSVESIQQIRSKKKSETKYDSKHPQSASSPVTATEKEQSQAAVAINSNPAQQQLLHILQALQAASAHSPQDTSSPAEQQRLHQQKSTLPSAVDQFRKQHTSGNSPEVMSNLLRSLTAPSPSAQSSKSPNTEGNGAVMARPASNTPRQGASKGTDLSINSQSTASPILGGLTPGYEADYRLGTSLDISSKAMAPNTAPSEVSKVKKEMTQGSISVPRSTAASRSKQCCYNCGIKLQRSWRHLALMKGETVRFQEGSTIWDHGKKLHRACNACGLYYNKYSGIHRPEHVWKEAQRAKQEQQNKIHEEKIHNGAKCDCPDRGDNDSAMEDSTYTLSTTKQLARTLSEVCERDSSRRGSFGEGGGGEGEEESDKEFSLAERAPARKVDDFEEARLKDFVQDRDGVWRTKRSLIENPSNKRPGRPKGSKTGQGQGRHREERLKKKRMVEKQQQVLLHTLEEGNNMASARSPRFASKHASFNMTGIHSSPVRSSSTFGQTAKTPGSAVSRIRYGAASYLLDSSPATAFQTVLNEAETDWHNLCGLSPRRSPRKHPQGTLSGLNPYATVNTSPSQAIMDTKQQLPSGNLTTEDLLKMTSSSPLTRSRVKSGQYYFDESWFSSEGLDFGLNDKKMGSSSVTSPGSPSPSPAHLQKRGRKRKVQEETMMLQPGQRPAAKKKSTSIMSEEQARKAARQARQAASTVGPSESNTTDGGPFMGLDLVESMSIQNSAMEDEEEEAGGGSPTLGRSRRMDRKRSANEELGSLSMHPSPTTAMLDFSQDWTRNTSMQELFPTPSPVKQWTTLSSNSPSSALWQSPTSWAIKGAGASPNKSHFNDRALKPVDTNQQQQQQQQQQQHQPEEDIQVTTEQQQLIRRKPLPATVEDASSSVNSASSTPRDDEEEDSLEEGNAANLMDLFEDPYGLLAASGIGGQINQPGIISMEDFNTIELFQNVDFTQQLEYFTQMGSNGVAAHIAPDQGGSSSSSTLKIEGKAISKEMMNNDNVGDVTITPGDSTVTSSIDFANLLQDPAMQALLAHMQQSPSKQQRQALMPSSHSHTDK